MAEYREFHCPYGDDFEGGDECDRCEQYELCMETYPPVNLIEIPKGATNGDMIKAMFSDMEINTLNGVVQCTIQGKAVFEFTLEFWNALYRKE